MTYVPHAGSGLGDAMWDQGYTEDDCEPLEPCRLCGHPDGDAHEDENGEEQPCPMQEIPECEGCEMPQANCCCG